MSKGRYGRFSGLAGVAVSLLAISAACSKGGSSNGGDYTKQAGQISAAFRPQAGELARGEAAQLLKQLEGTGNRDDDAIQSALSAPIAKLGNTVCDEIKSHSSVKKGNVEDAVRDFDRVLTEQTMVELGRQPRILTDLGFTTWGKWPQFALKQPAPPADAPVGELASTVPQVVKPEFVGPEGGLKLPNAGESGYDEFRQWYVFDSGNDNGLFNAASALGEPFRRSIRTCFGAIEGSK